MLSTRAVACAVAVAGLAGQACTSDSSAQPDPGAPPNNGLEGPEHESVLVLTDGLVVSTTPVPGDPGSALVVLKTARAICWWRTLTPSDGALRVDSDCDGRKISLDLQYVSPDGVCHNGGLYLLKGTASQSSGQSLTFTNIDLAGWNSAGLTVPTTMSVAPYAAPVLMEQATAGEWTPGAELTGIGRWTYSAHWGLLAPVPDCSTVANVSLTLQPPQPGAKPRTFEYRVEQKNVVDALLSTVTSPSADAPKLTIGPSGKPEIGVIALANISFGGLEIPTGASASLRVAYGLSAQVAAPIETSFAAPALATVDRSEEIPMSASATPQALAAHIGLFLDALSAPAAPSSSLRVGVKVALVTPVAGKPSTTRPLLTTPSSTFSVGLDGRSDCGAQATKSFACELATKLAAATTPADAGSTYAFDVSILGGPTGETRTALRLRNVTLPLALVSP